MNRRPRLRPDQKANYIGKPAAEMRADAQAHSDQQPITQSCLFCGWRWIGLVAEGRVKALAHHTKKHPEAVGRKTYRKPRSFKVGAVDDQVIEENRRLRNEREEAEKLATVERGRIRREQAA